MLRKRVAAPSKVVCTCELDLTHLNSIPPLAPAVAIALL